MSDKPNNKKPEDPKNNTTNPPNPSDPPSNPPSNNNNNNSNNNGTPSLASRIQTSASGLARNALYGSGPSADTAQLLASGGSKPGASSSSSRPSAFAAAQQYQETSGPSSASAAASRDPAPAQSFRSPAQQQQGGFALPALSEDEFQRSYGDIFTSEAEAITTPSSSSSSKGKEKASTQFLQPHQDSTTPLHHNQPTQYHHNQQDGSDVLTLLTSPTFDPEFPATEAEPFEPIETDLSATLTDAERTTLDSFRRQHHQSSSQPATRITSHSLIPDIGSFLDTVPAAAQSDATQLRDAVLSGLPGAADWVALEEQYSDEVWGYLKPTLQAAAKELEEREERGDSARGEEDGPAVRRLKMVLMHMRG
ncbi:hypothetical protein BDW42DRAFT_166037 [Aspergillus taichungensis]|uniref:Uncharacterized protein n=1 Tax=Aspergillus taichungensis TaxID=482145 RepID=A0A2J5HZ45_9EURO|nr:hypothetical protein BDW42DRAFT_166037 [Aspergillus taichungensis]